MAELDSFTQNIYGVSNLISSGTNKTDSSLTDEQPVGELVDEFELDMDDDELLALENVWRNKYAPYEGKIKVRQDRNKEYYKGSQGSGGVDSAVPISSNIIFESEETFIPQALAKNPEPVVWSDNTDEGKEESNSIKTMLQYHADVLCLNRTLGVMLRHWSVYLTGIAKHGWDKKAGDITLDVRNPQNFIFDTDGYIDVKGIYKGNYLGERIQSTAQDLIDLFPEHKAYITLKVSDKLGTQVQRIEWWTNEYCFVTFEDKVLDKHKNEFFNYDKEVEGLDENNQPTNTATPGINHFAHPQMPYTFLSVFSFQEAPHDVTNLIEQNIANQDRISMRDLQIDKNLRAGNNSLIVDPDHFNVETARDAAHAVEDGSPVLSNPDAIKRLPASPLPSGILESQQVAKDTLRSSFGVQGLTATQQTENTTARGMILNQAHDSTRIGGGIGDALEQVADSIFNFQLQMYYVFFDEEHYAAIMGAGKAVEYVALNMSGQKRQFVVSVSPDSMKPKDEVNEMNLAVERWTNKSIDPIGLMKALNEPDPMESAKRLSIWITNPAQYMAMFFPESAPQPQAMGQPQGGEAQVQGSPDTNLAQPIASASLGQVPLPQI